MDSFGFAFIEPLPERRFATSRSRTTMLVTTATRVAYFPHKPAKSERLYSGRNLSVVLRLPFFIGA
jgi:hypothetical protein